VSAVDGESATYLQAVLGEHFGMLLPNEAARIAERLSRECIEAGDVLYRQGESGDCMHFVLTGRLQVRRRDPPGDARIVAHRGSGQCVGEMALLTGEPRTADVVACRSTMLARLERREFEAILESHPHAGLAFARAALRALNLGTPDSAHRVETLALVPLDADVPIEAFGRRLEIALLRFGTTGYLDSAAIATQASREGPGALAIDRLLDAVEKERRFVICQADPTASDWTRKAVAHADLVLFVANADGVQGVTPIEQALAHSSGEFAQRELVLLHASRRSAPTRTAAWLAGRTVQRHTHVAWEGGSDFNRLARRIAGRAVTLVLGGGGARGLAQIGVVRAIREAGVPIDAVGGTSIGAIIGALVAFGRTDEQILQSCKRAFVDDRPLDDLTLPMFSLLRGAKLERTIRHYVGDVDIVDLWQPYFCVSTNLSKSRVDVHAAGSLWKAIQASASLPGLLPPVVADGDLHVDGAVLDNLPVGVMKRFIGGSTIAVESAVRDEYAVDGTSFPSPFAYLRSRFARQREPMLPTLPNLLIKSTVLGGRGGRAELREGMDLHIDLPLRAFGFLDWHAIYEIVDVGYRHAQACLAPWLEQSPHLQRRDERREQALRAAV
jgi:predicted acylesterase/phospholipase RssA/CRP-like cAMP-binding protein